MASKNTGEIIKIIGAVIDLRFENELPSLYNAIEIELDGETIVLEVMQHLGDNAVRCISMHPTDGLRRGMKAVDTGGSYNGTRRQRGAGSYGKHPGQAHRQ